MLFYFSATGNTRWASESMARLTHDHIVDIAEAMSSGKFCYTLRAGESVGFAFPVHGWRPPLIVRRFISDLILKNVSPQTYVYALCTAGDSIGQTMDYLSTCLAEKKLRLSACCSVIMPESYIGLPFMYLDKPEGERKKKDNAKLLLEKFAEMVNDRRGGDILVKGATPYLYSKVLGGFFYQHLITDSHFSVDKDKCLHCGICAHSCPVDDIEQKDCALPEWKHNGKCMTCFSCYHHCPTNAIEWGWFTKGKGQYVYK